MTHWIEPTASQIQSPLPGLHKLVGQTLVKRGFAEADSARAFLDAREYTPAPASDLPGLSEAVGHIITSLKKNEPICVWGDFDVDGQTSTTVLVESLKAVGAKVSHHIPVRQKESHGVNIENLARVIAEGVKLVVTCDTGISAHKEVEYARSRGVQMVISDHHDLPPELPEAAAVVNPKLLQGTHPLATLAGVGVAYKLAEELIQQLRPVDFQVESLLDLVALGLVADLAILRGDARYLVQKGLEQLRTRQRLGLKIVMELAELSATHLTEEHIGFALGPRLNAIGRLGDANPMVELLTTKNPVRARVLATQLEGMNVERKLRCDQVYQAAEAQLRANPELLTQPVIVLANPHWPGGIVGIVASRIVERYHKPAILLTSPDGEVVRGSARSIDGINITAAIAAQKNLLLGFGGHPMAAGLSLEAENLSEFRYKLFQSVQEMRSELAEEEGKLEIDGWIDLQDANLELAEHLESLAPFGPGNPKLILAIRSLTLTASTALGKNKEHLKLTVLDKKGTIAQVLWWDSGAEEAPSGTFDLAFSLRASDWRGLRQAQLELIDFRELAPIALDIKPKSREVLDYRKITDPQKTLENAMEMGDVICWAEAEDKKQVKGQDRSELKPAKTLIIWTTPPSRQVLLNALDQVKPEKVLVFAINPGNDEPRKFLERLAGLVKYILNHSAGKTSISRLASATAQNNGAIRLGLAYLEKQGQVSVEIGSDGILVLSQGGNPDKTSLETISTQLVNSMNESKAYRRHFQEQKRIDLE